jgi:hypothetical protein
MVAVVPPVPGVALIAEMTGEVVSPGAVELKITSTK